MQTLFTKSPRRAALLLVVAMPINPVTAAVMVVQNTAPGAASWLGAPVVRTFASPPSASIGESFNSGGGNTNFSQTFAVPTNITVPAIAIYVGSGGGSGTGPGLPLTLNLYDLGVQPTNPNPYSNSIIGGNLFG
jgi:hypothetical protein